MKDNGDIGIWQDTPVKIKHKCRHIKKMPQNYKKNFFLTGFTNDYGDIPIGRINPITNKFEVCDNNRGFGYAARKRLKYRNKENK